MATNGFAISADSIPIETTDYALPDLTPPSDAGGSFVGPTQDPSTLPSGLSPGVTQLSSGVDLSIDSSGDEGYVDSAGLLGGGNSVSSNSPNETCPAPGSPVAADHFSSPSGGILLEDLTKIGVAAAK